MSVSNTKQISTLDGSRSTPRKKKGILTITSSSLEGYLLKQNPNGLITKDFKRRWFSLSDRILYYFETKDSSSYLGNIDLRIASEIRMVDDKKYKDNCFEVVTPKRTYVLLAEDRADRRK
jgi:hypothetical protein